MFVGASGREAELEHRSPALRARAPAASGLDD